MALRRQQRKSCDLCRRRKVRCDLVSKGSGPCTTCDNGGVECVCVSSPLSVDAGMVLKLTHEPQR